jgi:hypothetical protein
MGQNLEPRFRQSIWTPDRGRLMDVPGRDRGNHRYPLVTTNTNGASSTGFRRYKGAVNDVAQSRNGDVDEILLRYGEALLNYAEAKAILGTITQGDLDKTVNVLRGRVNMPAMELSTVNSWDINYDAAYGFEPGAANVLNEIRRERTVELAFEGFRYSDLCRWAALEAAINGWKPQGANHEEFVYYYNSEDPEPALTAKNDGVADIFPLVLEGEDGKPNYGIFPNGNIRAFFNDPDFKENGEGFGIVSTRDYLSSIPSSERDLYKQHGVDLEQNPGWQ